MHSDSRDKPVRTESPARTPWSVYPVANPPAFIAPWLMATRPKHSYDPAVTLVYEAANVGLSTVLTQSPHDRVDFLDQLLLTAWTRPP